MACRIFFRRLNYTQLALKDHFPPFSSTELCIGNLSALKRLCSTDSTEKSSPQDLAHNSEDPRLNPGYSPPKLPQGVHFAVGPHIPKEAKGDGFDKEKLEKILQEIHLVEKKDHPNHMSMKDLPNPFHTEHHKCILCQYNVNLDYKNVRLLSQFVSPYTGRILPRYRTGLCIPMQKHVAKLIKRSRCLGFMPYIYKKPEYYDDPVIISQK